MKFINKLIVLSIVFMFALFWHLDTKEVNAASAVSVGDYPTLKSTIDGLNAGDSANIVITNNINMGTMITIKANVNVEISSSAGNIFSLYQPTSAARHFDVRGKLELSNMNITRNTTTLTGGGIIVEPGAELTINDGVTISNNLTPMAVTPNSRGGGVVINNGTFTMNGGSIRNNESSYYGGGIHVYGANGKFIMNAGDISANKSDNGGAGISSELGGNIVINKGTINGNVSSFSGGAIHVADNYNASITVNNATVTNNSAGGGGAIYCQYGNLSVSNSTFSNNNAVSYGGAIYLSNGNLSMSNVILDDNHLQNFDGGALFIQKTTTTAVNNVTLDHLTITNNTAGRYGAGIYFKGFTSYLTNSLIDNNSIVLSSDSSSLGYVASGGGIYNESSNLTISGSSINNNEATNGGGIYAKLNAKTSVDDTEFLANKAENSGGAIFTESGVLTIGGSGTYSDITVNSNVTFKDNSAIKSYWLNWEEGMYPTVKTTSTSIPSFHPINNYDINYIGLDRITVTFDSNEGTAVPNQFVVQGEKATIPTDPTKQGYEFAGWYTDNGTFNELWDFSTNTVNENITLYAKWIPTVISEKEVKIIFETNGGSEVKSQTIKSGTTVNKPANPTRQGYEFAGWYIDNKTFKNSWNFNTKVTNDMVLYAKWTPKAVLNKKVKVIFETNGGSEVKNQTIKSGTTVNKPINPTKQGYQFAGWHVDNKTFKNSWNFNTPVTNDKVLYARWTKNSKPPVEKTKVKIPKTGNEILLISGMFIMFGICGLISIKGKKQI